MDTALSISCPFCYQITCLEIGEPIDGLEIIEDCQNCCHPITVVLQVKNGQIIDFEATRE